MLEDMEDADETSKIFVFKPFTFSKLKVQGKEKPKPRSGHRVVCDEKNLYSYGGFNPSITQNDPDMRNDRNWNRSRPLFKELWKFNFVNQCWTRLPIQKSMPDELASNAVVLRGEALIVHGGTGVPFGENCNNKVYVCKVNDGQMHAVPDSGSRPDPQYGQAVICDGPFLYTVGGTTGYEYTCDIHRFDMRTQTWEAVYICSGKDQCEPKGRYRHELAFDGKVIYVFGGGTASEAFGFTEVPAFDTINNRWMTLCTQGDPTDKSIPAPRRCHGLVYYEDETSRSTVVVMSGGYNGTVVFDDVWRLNLSDMQWTCLRKSKLPQPVYFHSTALTPDGKMYSFGGIVKEADEITRTDEVHSIWLKIPKLSEICWEAINFYFPELKHKSRIELLNIGIPLKFIQRLQ